MENITIPKTIVMESVMYDADKRRKQVGDEVTREKNKKTNEDENG